MFCCTLRPLKRELSDALARRTCAEVREGDLERDKTLRETLLGGGRTYWGCRNPGWRSSVWVHEGGDIGGDRDIDIAPADPWSLALSGWPESSILSREQSRTAREADIGLCAVAGEQEGPERAQ